MNPIYGEHRKKSCICSFIFGRALTLKLCTARENIRTNVHFAGASTYRTTNLTTELTCRCHLCTTPFCSLQRAFILGFNLSWSFDGDCFCFVGWVVLGFGGFVLFCFLTYLLYQRGQKGEKNSKLQNLLCFLGLVSFLKILIRAEGLWLLQLDTIRLQRLPVIKIDMQSILTSYYSCTKY